MSINNAGYDEPPKARLDPSRRDPSFHRSAHRKVGSSRTGTKSNKRNEAADDSLRPQLDPSRIGPFLHRATGRRYWWSESDQQYIFEDGSRVSAPAPYSAPLAAAMQQVQSPQFPIPLASQIDQYSPPMLVSAPSAARMQTSSTPTAQMRDSILLTTPRQSGRFGETWMDPIRAPSSSTLAFEQKALSQQSPKLTSVEDDASRLRVLIEQLLNSKESVPYLPIPEDPTDSEWIRSTLISWSAKQRRFLMWYLMSLAFLVHKTFKGSDTRYSLRILFDALDEIHSGSDMNRANRFPGRRMSRKDSKMQLCTLRLYLRHDFNIRTNIEDLSRIAKGLVYEKRVLIVKSLDHALTNTRPSAKSSRSNSASQKESIPKAEEAMVPTAVQDVLRKSWHSKQHQGGKGSDASKKAEKDHRIDQVLMNPVMVLHLMSEWKLWSELNDEEDDDDENEEEEETQETHRPKKIADDEDGEEEEQSGQDASNFSSPRTLHNQGPPKHSWQPAAATPSNYPASGGLTSAALESSQTDEEDESSDDDDNEYDDSD